MADKQIVVPVDFNLKEAKEFVFHNTASAQPNAAATLGQVYYNQTLKRILYTTISDVAGTTRRWVRIPRVDGAEEVVGLWEFTRPATSGAPFAVVSDVMVNNLTANKLGSGKWEAQLAVAANMIPVRTTKTGTQSTDWDGQIVVPLTPMESNHAASRLFVEQLMSGSVEKPACRVGTPSAIPGDFDATAGTITGLVNASINTAGIDGVRDLAIGDRVLVISQGGGPVTILGSDNEANGIYEITALGEAGASGSKYVLTRAADFNHSDDIADGASVFVAQGDAFEKTQWSLLTHGAITLNQTDLQFTRTSGTRVAHEHPANDITAGIFNSVQLYTFKGALAVGTSYFSTGTGIFFGETASTFNDAARIIQIGGTRTLQIRGNPIGTQALVNLNSTGPNAAVPSIKAVRNHSTDQGEITFNANNTAFSKPIQPPEDPTTAAWGTLHRTKFGSGSGQRKIPQWQTTGSIVHWIARKYVREITSNGTLGTDGNPFVITHNLGTKDVIVQVRRESDYKEVIVEAYADTEHVVKVSFGIAPPTSDGKFKVIVIG